MLTLETSFQRPVSSVYGKPSTKLKLRFSYIFPLILRNWHEFYCCIQYDQRLINGTHMCYQIIRRIKWAFKYTGNIVGFFFRLGPVYPSAKLPYNPLTESKYEGTAVNS